MQFSGDETGEMPRERAPRTLAREREYQSVCQQWASYVPSPRCVRVAKDSHSRRRPSFLPSPFTSSQCSNADEHHHLHQSHPCSAGALHYHRQRLLPDPTSMRSTSSTFDDPAVATRPHADRANLLILQDHQAVHISSLATLVVSPAIVSKRTTMPRREGANRPPTTATSTSSCRVI